MIRTGDPVSALSRVRSHAPRELASAAELTLLSLPIEPNPSMNRHLLVRPISTLFSRTSITTVSPFPLSSARLIGIRTQMERWMHHSWSASLRAHLLSITC